jgi:hypothetical protein
MSRAEVLDCTRAWVRRVLAHPRDKWGNLCRSASPGNVQSLTDVFRQQLFQQGWPDYRIEEQVQRMLQESREASGSVLGLPFLPGR